MTLRVFVLRDRSIVERAQEFLGSVQTPAENAKAKLHEVVVREHKTQRSKAQNRLLHMWMRFISRWYFETHGKLYAPDVWKVYFKRRFLGQELVECRGESWAETRHTSGLSVKEMSDFLNDIEYYCGSEWQLSLPRPNDMWAEAMGRAA